MRCPKCNFVSYDLLETCVKCGKHIGSASKELQGTVASISPPPFLHFGDAGSEEEAVRGGGAESEVAFDLGGEEETVIDLGAEEGSSPTAGGLDLVMEETAAEQVNLGGPVEEEVVKEEAVFSLPAEEPQAAGFEISDLAPRQEAAKPVEEAMVPEPEFAAAEEQPPTEAPTGLGLADLKVEGIDLESVPAKGKLMSAVKTGTALDEFDIDLKDLLSRKK